MENKKPEKTKVKKILKNSPENSGKEIATEKGLYEIRNNVKDGKITLTVFVRKDIKVFARVLPKK